MLPYVLLSLIGVGMFASVFDSFDDEDLTNSADTPSEEEGSENADALIGTGANDLLSGLQGNDDLRGYGGDDTLLGGEGDDLAVGGPGDDSLQGSLGEDTLWGREGNDFLDGGFGDDTLRGDDGDDTLRGGDDDDALIGGEGDDALIGNRGNDLIETGNGADTVYGGDGDDRITGFKLPTDEGVAPGEEDIDADELNGGDGNDTITGNADDIVTGGAGADLIRSLGIDQEDGGGVIVTDFDPTEDSLLLAASSGEDAQFEADDPRLEVLQDSNGVDTNVFVDERLLAVLRNTDAEALAEDMSWLVNVSGLPEAAPVAALPEGETPADDTVDSDTVEGATDEEIVAQEDEITPAPEDVIADDEEAVPEDVVEEDTGSVDEEDTLTGDAGDDTLAEPLVTELISGEDGADTLTGSAGDDVLEAGDGTDLINGGAGNDLIYGYAAAGGPLDTGVDVLNGGDGLDTIIGNDGDLITGGAGADQIHALESAPADAVVVTDFDPAEDMLVLADAEGTALVMDDPDDLSIQAAANGSDTEVIYRGQILALLQDTDPVALAADQSWLGNILAIPTPIAA